MCNLAFIAFKVLFIHTIAFFAKSRSITSGLLYIVTILSLCIPISSNAVNLQVRVCDLCEILDDTIQDVGTSVKNEKCYFSDCLKRNKLNILLDQSDLFSNNFTKQNEDVFFHMNSNHVAKLFVYAFIARQFIEIDSSKTFDNLGEIIRYDIQKQTIIKKKPVCAFEKQIYSLLLIITVVTILISYAMQIVKQNKTSTHRDL